MIGFNYFDKLAKAISSIEFKVHCKKLNCFKGIGRGEWPESEDAKKDEWESRRVEVANNEVSVEVEVAYNARSEALPRKNSGSF